MITNENFIVVQGFMVNELELKGNELLTYAIIYGFSQDGESEFTGSLSYLQHWVGYTKKTAITTLQSLVKKGLIERRERTINNVKFNAYRITPVVKNLHRGGEKITPNNIEDNIPPKKKEIKERKKFVPPTLEEVKAYCEERKNGIDPKAFIAHYEVTKWTRGKKQIPIQDWKACVRTWEARKQAELENKETDKDYSEFYYD